jgi:preprotein translocase subunit Sec63
MAKDYYEILGVAKGCSDENELKKGERRLWPAHVDDANCLCPQLTQPLEHARPSAAYRKLAMKFHPVSALQAGRPPTSRLQPPAPAAGPPPP